MEIKIGSIIQDTCKSCHKVSRCQIIEKGKAKCLKCGHIFTIGSIGFNKGEFDTRLTIETLSNLLAQNKHIKIKV